jgi:signal transduction histidine kinase
MTYKPQKLYLSSLIEENIAIFSESLKRKSLSLRFDNSGESYVYVDKEMVSTVIRNVVSNAIKFTSRGGKIDIAYSDFEKNGEDQVVVSVKDNGIGMNKETLSGLFKIDSGISISGTEGELGTGLGLIICNDFIEKNLGEIWVESEPNKGSTFLFTLPIFTKNIAEKVNSITNKVT